MAKPKSFGIEVSLNERQMKSLSELLGSDTVELGVVTALLQTALSDLADGGTVLPGPVVRRLVEVIGCGFDPEDLIPFVEQAHRMDKGKTVVAWKIDPVLVEYYRQAATNAGVSLEQYLNNFMAMVQQNGALGSYIPPAEIVYFSYEDMRWLREATGKQDLTGTELTDYVRSLAVATELQAAR